MTDSSADSGKNASNSVAYILGHSDQELDRLSAQARLVDPITRRFLHDSGIVAGMRVLDVGSGAGDVSFLVADLVGPAGKVVGVDRASAAIAAARARADRQAVGNVSFVEGDPAEMKFEQPFDAVIGRYVLMFQPNPAAMLRRLAGHVRSGGVIMFHEVDWHGVQSNPPSPTYARCCRWLIETSEMNGNDMRMGMKLHSTFLSAGLPTPSMRLEAIIRGGANSLDLVHFITGVFATLLPEMERLGIATANEVDLQSLGERLSAEVASAGVLVGRSEIGAWSRAGH
jgi:SAM-dependent methyltransferase